METKSQRHGHAERKILCLPRALVGAVHDAFMFCGLEHAFAEISE